MATITTTTSLSFDAAASLTVGVDKNFEGSIAFTSANDDVWPSFTVTKPQSKTYGPFGIAMTVVITVGNGSLDYTINGGMGGFGYDTDGNVTGLVSGDGTTYPLTPLTVTMAQATAQLAAASVGATWRISDIGGGTYWEKSATGILRPVNNICCAADIAAPSTFAAGVAERIYAEYLLPAKALNNGFLFDVGFQFSKSGATDAFTMRICLSSVAGTAGTGITQSGAVALMAAANRRAQGSFRFQRLSATTINNWVTNTAGNAGIGLVSGGAYSALTVPSMDAAFYLQVCGTAGGSTDTLTLESAPVTIFGGTNS